MQLIKTNKSVFFTSIAVLALATTSLIASADARPHHRKARHYVAATAGNAAVDDRYAHVAQGGFSMMMQPQYAMRQQPTTRQSRRVARQGREGRRAEGRRALHG